MRNAFILLVSCVVVLLSGYVIYRSYGVWKQDHMISLAKAYLKRPDEANAILSLQQALRSNPRNVEATRMMADLAEANRLPSALLWRSRVVEFNPFSLNDRLALAQTAMTMGDIASATNALAGILEADRRTAGYHNVAGAVAAGLNQIAEAETHFTEASRLEPQNLAPQLNLAVVRLRETNNFAAVTGARDALRRLSANPTNSTLRCKALRELAIDALNNKDDVMAVALSSRLLKETNSSFADKTLRLTVLQQTHDPDFKNTLKDYQRQAAGDNAKIYELGNWQMANTSPGEVLSWLRSLPIKTQTNQPSAFMIAECYEAQKDWVRLRDWTAATNFLVANGSDPANRPLRQNWREIDFIRHAFQCLALRELNLTDSAKAEWEEAFKAAKYQEQSLKMLLRFAAQWNWANEGEDVLHAIVVRYPNEEWAAQALVQLFYASGQTRSMMQYYSQEVKRFPLDLDAKNNLALTALLLEEEDKQFNPYELAHEVYQKSPTNALYATTYAFSLYMNHKNGEALKIIEQLKPEELQKPSRAGYYGLILKAAGEREKAKTFLDLSSKEYHLPEEQRLFEKAKVGI